MSITSNCNKLLIKIRYNNKIKKKKKIKYRKIKIKTK